MFQNYNMNVNTKMFKDENNVFATKFKSMTTQNMNKDFEITEVYK